MHSVLTVFFIVSVFWSTSITGALSVASSWSIGMGTSSFQIEGGRHGRSDTIWDRACDQGLIADRSNADVACDSFHRYEEDIYWLQNLGIRDYRFSFAWARLFAEGNVSTPSPDGIRYYHRLLDSLADNNIRAHGTLFHWDLPEALQDAYGGMLDRDRFRHDFGQYARAVFEEYGQKLDTWYSFNEPYTVCSLGFGNGYHAPNINEPAHAPYDVGHTILLAHGDARRAFQDAKTQGLVRADARLGIVLNSDFYYPLDPQSEVDRAASDRAVWFRLGWFLAPVLTGQYPTLMREIVGSRLPFFSEEEAELIRGSVDVIALNYYTSMNIRDRSDGVAPDNFFADPMIEYSKIHESIPSQSTWLFLYPEGLHGLVGWVHDKFPTATQTLPVQITETGVSTPPGQWQDYLRIQCMNHTFSVIETIHREGLANVTHVFFWSLLDNFEWAMGYLEAFGIVQIDFQNPDRTRQPKLSFYWLQNYLL